LRECVGKCPVGTHGTEHVAFGGKVGDGGRGEEGLADEGLTGTRMNNVSLCMNMELKEERDRKGSEVLNKHTDDGAKSIVTVLGHRHSRL
jgi:hypothetical protein